MRNFILAICIISVSACSYAPPLRVMVDLRVTGIEKYEATHAICLEEARARFPLGSEMRSPMAYVAIMARAQYQNQKMYVTDCLTKAGYRVLNQGEPWYDYWQESWWAWIWRPSDNKP